MFGVPAIAATSPAQLLQGPHHSIENRMLFPKLPQTRYFRAQSEHIHAIDRFRLSRILRENSQRGRQGTRVTTGGVKPTIHRHKDFMPPLVATVLATDVVGYTRLMEADEQGTHDRLMHLRFSVMEPIIQKYEGRVVKNTGDGFLAIFPTPQKGCRRHKNYKKPP